MNCNIKDVARKAGVSVGTVSRVINGSDTVAEERVAAVNNAIQELGYRKNSAAQLLAGRRGGSRLLTGNIGLWMAEMGDDWISNPVYTNYLSGIEAVCAARGYHVLIEHGGVSGYYPRCLHEGKVDGLIVKALNEIPGNLQELAEQVPLIGLSMYDRRLPLPQVATDNQLAGEEVCRYLWERGHRRIGFVCNAQFHQMFFERRVGFEHFLSRRGAYDPRLVGMFNDTSRSMPEARFPEMDAVVDMLLSNPSPPTAIVAANDWMAAGLYEALAGRGIRIPQEIGVIAFDHLVNLFLRPRLTSFEIPMHEMGRAAAGWLLDRIGNHIRRDSTTGPEFRMVNGKIIEHGSVISVDQMTPFSPKHKKC